MSRHINNFRSYRGSSLRNPALHYILQEDYRLYRKAVDAVFNVRNNKSGFDIKNKPEDKGEKRKIEQRPVAESSNSSYSSRSNVNEILDKGQRPVDNAKPKAIKKIDAIKNNASRENISTRYERMNVEIRRRRIVNFRKKLLKMRQKRAAERNASQK